MQGKKKYQEQLFISFQLSEYVPQDNFYRRLKDVLELHWLYTATQKYYGTEGQESIDPVVFFKLILIGYLENQPSDRKIISMASMRLDMLYFIGYNIGEPLPWHSTLSRTRQLYGKEVFQQLFRQILKQCIAKQIVAGRRQAIDSGLVKANASMDSLLEKEVLEDGDVYIKSLKEAAEGDDKDKKDDSGTLAAGKGKLNKTHCSSTDADARVATKPGKPTQLYYLAQVSVDTLSHVITNIEAHHADKGDGECLGEALSNTISNLETEGLMVKEVLADTRYSNGKALKYLEDNNILGYIPNTPGYKPEREGFIYDKQNDQYICSQGTQLPYKTINRTEYGTYKKEYRSSSKACKGCSLREQCIGKTAYKKITDVVDKPLYDRMYERMQTKKARSMQKLRQSTVEPVIGSLLNFMGMRRLNTRGIKQANKCMIMAALAYNLKKLLKYRMPKARVDVKEMEKWQQKVLEMLFGVLWQPVVRYTTMQMAKQMISNKRQINVLP